MTPTLYALTLAALLAADPPSPGKDRPREPNPFAPSLPLLTEEEEDDLDRIIDNFIKFDTGKLSGAEARKAKAEFDKLGPEAIPALIRGLNRAATIEDSCPAVVIAKVIARMVSGSNDTKLMDFVRDNVGAGVGPTRHGGVLKDLKFVAMMRRNLLARRGPTAPATAPVTGTSTGTSGGKSLSSLSVGDLAEAAGKEQGTRLKQVLAELGQRRGSEAVTALAAAATSYDGDVQKVARDGLVNSLSRLGATDLAENLKDSRPEVRAAAARVVGAKGLRLVDEVIDLLRDDDKMVADAAHDALVRLNRGRDLGPAHNAGDSERDAAVKKWREWWARQSLR
jgi:hypothetical protein